MRFSLMVDQDHPDHLVCALSLCLTFAGGFQGGNSFRKVSRFCAQTGKEAFQDGLQAGDYSRGRCWSLGYE